MGGKRGETVSQRPIQVNTSETSSPRFILIVNTDARFSNTGGFIGRRLNFPPRTTISNIQSQIFCVPQKFVLKQHDRHRNCDLDLPRNYLERKNPAKINLYTQFQRIKHPEALADNCLFRSATLSKLRERVRFGHD